MKRLIQFLALVAILAVPMALNAQGGCTDYTSVPYTTGFEGLSTGQLPSCWQQVQTGSSGSGTFPSAYVWTNSRNGDVYFEFESNSGQTEIAALPLMENINTLKLTFWASLMNHNFMLEVGVMEGTTFVPVDTIENLIVGSGGNWHGSYHEYTVYFNEYYGSGERMAMRVTSSGSYTLMLDDLTVSEDNGCYPLSNLTGSAIDSESVTLSWVDEMNVGASYTVTYWKDGGDTTSVAYLTDTFYTVTGLDANSNYHFVVMPNCSTGDGIPVTGDFRTSCGTTAIPYNDGLEDYASNATPNCWTVLSGEPRAYTSNVHTGSRSLYFYGASSGGSNTIALPPLNMPLANVQMHFWTRPSSTSSGTFQVGYMSDLSIDSTFVPVATYSASELGTTYAEKIVQFPGAPDPAYIVLRHTPTGYNSWYVDDISITEFSGCYSVSNVVVTDADSASISLSWSDNGNSGATYTVAYWKDGGDTVEVAGITDTFYVAGSLDASSGYHFIVTPNCSMGDGYPVSINARTTCGVLVVPFLEGFETADAIECWSKVSCAASTGQNNGSARTGSGCFRFYYNTNPPQYLLTPPLGGTDNEGVLLSFWYKKYSNSYTENFKVGYSTTTADPSAFTWGSEVNPTTNYQEFTAVYPAGVRYIAIQYMQNNGYYLYIDDYNVSIDNGCNKPNDAYIDSVGPYAAYLRWTSGGASAASYNLYYNTTNSLSGATMVGGITDTTYALTGLLPQTTYYAWVRTDCGSDSSDTKPFNSFTTQLTCAQLTGVTMGDINYTGAVVNWSYNTSVGFPSTEVIITLTDDTDTTFAPITVTTTGTSYMFTGLEAGHGYTATIRNICDAMGQSDTAAANTISFMTTSCAEVSEDGASGNTYIPTYTYYNYSYAQAIYTNAQMPNIDTIHGISFNNTSAPASGNVRNWNVYMGHTSLSSFSGSNSWIPVDSMMLVASNVSFDASTTGWKVISFDSTFVYDGSSNLVIAVDDNTGSYKSGPTWASLSASNQGLSIYGDGTNYDPHSPGSGTVRGSIPAVRFVAACDVPTCFAPMVAVDSTAEDAISIHWAVAGIESSWLVGIKAAGAANFTYAGPVTDTFYTFTGLTSNTEYTILVGSLCTDTLITTLNVTTNCGVTSVPYFTGFEGLSNGQLPNCWQQVQAGNSGSGTFPSAYVYSNSYNGSVYFEFESNSGQTEIAALPNMANISSLMLTFYASLMNHNFVLEAGVMEGNTFVPVDTISGLVVGSGGNWHGSYHEYDVVFSNYTGTGDRIALRVTATGSYTLMLDDLSVSVNTGCPRPDFPTVTTVLSDQIGLSLSGSSTGDYKLYISDGAGYVDSASVMGANSYTFTGLSPVTTYTIDVHADCGTSISSPRTVTATTTLVADTLPYSTGFETTDDVAWMLLNGTATNKWYIDSAVASTGSQSLYISDNNGVSNTYSITSTSYALAYKLFQFDSIGDYAISYDWHADGESSLDFIRVALVPGTYEFQANATNGISSSSLPSGWIALDGGSKLNLNGNWQNHSEVFSISTASNYYVLFYWRNDGSVGNNPPGAIDNVQISRLSCPAPQNLTLTSATTNSISFSWTPAGSEIQWEVVFDGDTTIESTPSFSATGLASSTSYPVSIRAVCAIGDTSFALNGTFRTTCGEITTFPWVEDFEAAGVLECWDQAGNSSWTVGTGDYSTSTGAHSGSMNARCVHNTTGNVTKLISPVLAMTPGSPATLSFWHIQRSWAGDIDSLVVYYRASMTDSWHRLAGYSGAIASWTQDSIDLPNVSATYQIAFEMHDDYGYGVGIDDITVDGVSSGCSAPVIGNVTTDVESITVGFVAYAPVEIAIVEGNQTNPPAATDTTSASSYTFTGLNPSTLYTIFLRQHCTDSTVSDWAYTTATTEDLGCVPPTGLNVQGTGYTSVTLGWTRGNEEIAWQVNVFNNTYDSVYTVGTNPVVISGLIPAVTYNARIRSLCGTSNNLPGEWSEDTVTFTTATCPDVENLVISNLTAHSADASWNPTTGVQGYSVLWFMEDIEQGDTTVQNPAYHLDGLEAEMPYRVLVKNICAPGAMSEHWAEAEFITLADNPEGIDQVSAVSLMLHPNPASSTVTVRFDGFGYGAMVEIVDMNGRTVRRQEAGAASATISLDGLAQGAYFVRVTGDTATAVRRLIVR